MVFLNAIRCIRSKGPDEFWKNRRVFMLTANFRGRRRNCYSIAIRSLQKALKSITFGRKQKKLDRRELWMKRIDAGAVELETNYKTVMDGLTRCNIDLNNKVMSEMAVYEPRTFQALVKLGQMKMFQEKKRGLYSIEETPTGVITRGML